MWVEEIVAYLYLYGDGLFSEQLREWQWQVNELQLQTSLRWHSYITYNLTALRSFPLHSATLQLLPHTQFSFPRLGLLINVCPPIVSLVQCSFSVTLCLIVQTKPQRRPANAINLSSKFLERHSLATEDPSCLVWFPPQRLGFPSSHSSVCVWPHGFVCVAVGVGGFLCVFCQITAHCLVCLGMYTYAQSSAIKAFVSITENVPLAGIVFSSPSSPLLFLTAAAWFLQWRQRFHFSLYFSLFHHFIITISASLDFRLACSVLRVFQGGWGPTIFLYSKKYLLDILCYAKSTFSNGRIHFRNAWRYFLGEVI